MTYVPLQAAAARLQANIKNLSHSDQKFAGSLLAAFNKYGKLSDKQKPWVFTLADRAEKPVELPKAVEVGNMGGVLALFAKASQHLKYPAIVVSVPKADTTMRITVAGERAKIPGSLNVTSQAKADDGRRDWFGRVLTDGSFQPGLKASGTAGVIDAVAARLAQFAADPVGVASEHAKLTGCCCFCNKQLTTKESTAVGYGPDCADHYGLPWGKQASKGSTLLDLAAQVVAQAS